MASRWRFEVKPDLPEKVLDAVLADVPKSELLICCAVKANLRYNGDAIKDGIFVATPNFALAFKKSLGRYSRLCIHHVVHLSAFIVSKESEGFLIRGKHTNLIVFTPQHLKISRILFRNFSCITKGINGKRKPEIATYSDELYPPFTFNISPGQEFQFLYSAYASLYAVFPDICVIHRFHQQFKLLNFAFNLPTYHKTGKQLIPIYKAAACLPYFTSFFSNLSLDDNPIEGLRFFVKYQSDIRYVNVTECPANTDFDNLVKTIEKHNVPLRVRAWRIAGKSFVNTTRFMSNLVKQTEMDVKMVDFSGMSMSKDALLILLKGLTREHFHSVEFLGFGYVRDAGMSCVSAFKKYIDELMSKNRFNLKILSIPGMRKSRHYVRVLQSTKYPIEKLNIGHHKLKEAGRENVIEFAANSETLKELDISGTKFPPEDVTRLIQALAKGKNENPMVLKLSSNNFRRKIAGILSALLDNSPEKWKGLEFDQNHLDVGSLKILISVASKLPNLQKLSLSRNFASSTRDIGKQIAKLITSTSLKTLYIRGGVKGRLGQEALPVIEALKFNTTLEKLDITGNDIGSEGIDLLAQAVTVNKTLRWLQCDRNKVSTLSCLANFVRAFTARPESMHLPFPDSDTRVLYARSPSKEAAGRQIIELESHLMFTLALHRRGTKWDRLPVTLGRVPYKELIRDVSYDIEDMPEVQMRYIHSCVSAYFGLPLPFQWVKDAPKYGEENIDVDDDKLDVYEMPNLKIMVRESDDVDDCVIDPRTRIDFYFPTIVPENVRRHAEEEEKNEPTVKDDDSEKSESNSSENESYNQNNSDGDEYKGRRKLNYAFDTVVGGESQPKRSGKVKAPAMVVGKQDSDGSAQGKVRKGKRMKDSESSDEELFKNRGNQRRKRMKESSESDGDEKPARKRTKFLFSSDSDEEIGGKGRPVQRKSRRSRASESDSEEKLPRRNSRRQTRPESDSEEKVPRRNSRRQIHSESDSEEKPFRRNSRKQIRSESDSEEKPFRRNSRRQTRPESDSEEKVPRRNSRRQTQSESDSEEKPFRRNSRKQIRSESDSEEKPRRRNFKRKVGYESDSDEQPPPRKSHRSRREESDSDESPGRSNRRLHNEKRQPSRRSLPRDSDSDTDRPIPRQPHRKRPRESSSSDEPVWRRTNRNHTSSEDEPIPRASRRLRQRQSDSDEYPLPRKSHNKRRSFHRDSDSSSDEPPPRRRSRHVAWSIPT